jgi:hypothetical protein
MITRRWATGAIILSIGLAGSLVGCGESSDPELLSQDSVPGVEETYAGDKIPAVGWCREVNTAQSRASTGSRPPASGVEFRLENGDYVHAIVMGPASGRSIEDIRGELEDAVATCTTKSTSGQTVEALSGLTDGRWGYSSTERGATGRQIFEVTPKGYLLAVGVRHEGDGEPSVDVQELIQEAEKKADGYATNADEGAE